MKFYRFLTGEDDSKFCHKVTEALSKGWELYSSPQLSYDAKQKKFRCGQAVIKISKKKYTPSTKLSSI